MKNKYLALLLSLVSIFTLGLLPLHCFYLNRASKGFLFVIMFWTMVPTIWSICDFIRMLFMSPLELENYSRPYNRQIGAPVQQNVVVNITKDTIGTDV